MKMIREWGEVYAGSWRFVRACPLLVAIPVIAEGIQHVAEFHIGMYDTIAGARAADTDTLRLGLGLVKTVAICWLGYHVLRWFALGESAARARRFEARAVRGYALFVLFTGVVTAASLWGAIPLRAIGLGERPILVLGLAFGLASFLVSIYLAAWMTAAALGNEAIGFLRSFAIVHGHFWWGLGLTLLAILPLMVVHYLFGGLAIGRPQIAYPLVALDTLFVGYLSTALAAVSFMIARRASVAKGIALVPSD